MVQAVTPKHEREVWQMQRESSSCAEELHLHQLTAVQAVMLCARQLGSPAQGLGWACTPPSKTS